MYVCKCVACASILIDYIMFPTDTLSLNWGMIHDIITPQTRTVAPSRHTRRAREVIQADYAHTQLLHILARVSIYDIRLRLHRPAPTPSINRQCATHSWLH